MIATIQRILHGFRCRGARTLTFQVLTRGHREMAKKSGYSYHRCARRWAAVKSYYVGSSSFPVQSCDLVLLSESREGDSIICRHSQAFFNTREGRFSLFTGLEAQITCFRSTCRIYTFQKLVCVGVCQSNDAWKAFVSFWNLSQP